MSTALEIANSVLAEVGLPTVTTLYGVNAIATGTQLGALLNRVCKELNADYDWTRIMREQTFYLESPFTLTGDVTEGSKVITGLSSTAALSNAFALQNEGSTTETNFLQSSRVAEVIDATSVRMNQAAIASGTGVSISFVRDTYTLESSFARYISDTWWDRTNNWRLIGPITPQTASYLQSGIVQTGPRRRWRQVGPGPSTWQIWPSPFSAGDTPAILAFEYITLAIATDIDGEPVDTMTEDTDTPVFPEHVMVLGLKAYFWQVKGFDWKPYWQMYVEAARRAQSQDGSKATILIGSTRFRDDLMSLDNVQDGNFPGPGMSGWS